jgi:putative ABC transport system permease protein
VALDEVTAQEAGISAADVRRCVGTDVCRAARVQVVPTSEHAPRKVHVVAIFKFGTVGNLAGATLAAFDVHTLQTLLNKEGKFDEIHADAAPGISDVALRNQIRAEVKAEGISGVEVLTGKQLAADQSDEIRDNLKFFNIFLLVFAAIALFVGAFIIYNTFSIIVAQRTHELGLLRGLGASGRQVMTTVAAEALAVGLISSFLGLIVGIGFAIGLQEVLKAFDVELPSGDTIILGRTIIVSVLVGTVVTVVSAIAPARRAAKVSPIAAMQVDATGASSGNRRYVVGGLIDAIGVVLLGLGLFANVDAFPGGSAALVGLAAAMVFVGAAMLSPLVAQPVSAVVGWIPARFRGIPGVLARENAGRNPRRTATTAAALMIGVALLTLVAIMGSSLRSTFGNVIENDFRAEYLLRTKNFTPFSPQAASDVRDALPGGQVTEFRFGNFELNGETKAMLGVNQNLGRTLDVHPRSGALRNFRADGGMLIFKDAYAELPRAQRKAGVLNLRFRKGGEVVQVRIAGVFDQKDAIGNDFLLAMPVYKANVSDQANQIAAVRLPDGMSLQRGARILDRVLVSYPSVLSQDQQTFKESQEAQIGQFLNLINALLAFAVGIAILGVANTLALSIYERTHEIGLLRAVGTTRQQVRQMIRYESIIISVFGSLLGIVLGLVFGRALIAALEDDGIHFALSLGGLVPLVFGAIIAGWIAAWGPARRAARLDVLQAVQSQ